MKKAQHHPLNGGGTKGSGSNGEVKKDREEIKSELDFENAILFRRLKEVKSTYAREKQLEDFRNRDIQPRTIRHIHPNFPNKFGSSKEDPKFSPTPKAPNWFKGPACEFRPMGLAQRDNTLRSCIKTQAQQRQEETLDNFFQTCNVGGSFQIGRVPKPCSGLKNQGGVRLPLLAKTEPSLDRRCPKQIWKKDQCPQELLPSKDKPMLIVPSSMRWTLCDALNRTHAQFQPQVTQPEDSHILPRIKEQISFRGNSGLLKKGSERKVK